MSTIGKVIGALAILILIVLGVRAARKPAAPATTTQDQTQSQSATTTSSSAPANPVASRDSSDASLTADLSSIDAQLNAFDKSSAQVDQSVNDKPVAQTE
jgi:FtsZ-interacting cell division protein ZipA